MSHSFPLVPPGKYRDNISILVHDLFLPRPSQFIHTDISPFDGMWSVLLLAQSQNRCPTCAAFRLVCNSLFPVLSLFFLPRCGAPACHLQIRASSYLKAKACRNTCGSWNGLSYQKDSETHENMLTFPERILAQLTRWTVYRNGSKDAGLLAANLGNLLASLCVCRPRHIRTTL
jgi:hypothetical protein